MWQQKNHNDKKNKNKRSSTTTTKAGSESVSGGALSRVAKLGLDIAR